VCVYVCVRAPRGGGLTRWLGSTQAVLCSIHAATLARPAQAPFRFPRIVILGSLGVGAAAGLVIILFRLATSLKGARALTHTSQGAGLVGLGRRCYSSSLLSRPSVRTQHLVPCPRAL